MLGTVVVGVDGRAAGRDAIALARLLVAGDGRLTLAHIHHGDPEARDHAGPASDAAARSRQLLEQEQEATAVDADLEAAAASSVGRGLHQLVESSAADLLVVGSSSRGFVGRVLLGSDTRAALNGAPCAVAVAPVGYAHDLTRLATIGVGFDGSAESVAALALAREVASRHDATLRALSVVQIPGSPWSGLGGVAWGGALDELVAAAQRRLEALDADRGAGAPELHGGGSTVLGETAVGVPGEELAAFAGRVDLLVVGSRGYGPVRRLMFGSTSEYLVGHARCPLLVLPRLAHAHADANTGSQAASP